MPPPRLARPRRARGRAIGFLACACAAVLALAGAPAAGATTFGADLSGPVTNAATCANAFPFAPGAPSCLVYSVTPSAYPGTGSGIVHTVRIKTADLPQGPMQVVVLRSYYQNNLQDPGHPNFFCCFLQEYGPTFTPTRNAVTTVPATLGLVEQPTPASSDGNTVAAGDFLALSILAPNVPIPMTASPNSLAAFNAGAPLAPSNPPAPSPNAITGGQGSASDTLMMNADIDPLDGAPPPGPGPAPTPDPGPTPAPEPTPVPVPTPTPTKPAPVTLKTTGGRFTSSSASLPLACQLTTTCKGALTVRDRRVTTTGRAASAKAKKKAKPKKAVVLGTVRFSVDAGRTKTVKVKLNAAGRKAAKRAKRLTLYATATITGSPAVTAKLTLSKPRR